MPNLRLPLDVLRNARFHGPAAILSNFPILKNGTGLTSMRGWEECRLSKDSEPVRTFHYHLDEVETAELFPIIGLNSALQMHTLWFTRLHAYIPKLVLPIFPDQYLSTSYADPTMNGYSVLCMQLCTEYLYPPLVSNHDSIYPIIVINCLAVPKQKNRLSYLWGIHCLRSTRVLIDSLFFFSLN